MGNGYALSILHLKERGGLRDSTSRNRTGLSFWLKSGDGVRGIQHLEIGFGLDFWK
jgi:hypothetical protein